jgi:hypothetical protein
MRGYGLPRNDDVEFPDMVSIYELGLKSCIGGHRSKDGDYRAVTSPEAKAKARRRYKRRARAEGKIACKEIE